MYFPWSLRAARRGRPGHRIRLSDSVHEIEAEIGSRAWWENEMLIRGARELGKVFISHTASDKPFVRKLAAGIRTRGYNVWLDEHELLAGDALPEKISSVLSKSRVVLVVVSRSVRTVPVVNGKASPSNRA